jgi:serine/threonine-protein kinase RsbT
MHSQPKGKVRIHSEGDIVNVRKTVREISAAAGFSVTDVTRIVTAASELARNIFHYAGSGDMYWQTGQIDGKYGIELLFVDEGPGIEDIEQSMEMGFTTRGGLGLGLPGAKRLMDDMTIRSDAGKGTSIRVRKWTSR